MRKRPLVWLETHEDGVSFWACWDGDDPLCIGQGETRAEAIADWEQAQRDLAAAMDKWKGRLSR